MEFDFEAIDEEDSPYPEVRASVSNIDDPEMLSLTIRMWLVGLTLCMISRRVVAIIYPWMILTTLVFYQSSMFSAMNVFFNFRQPAPTVVPLVLLLISYPIGKFLAFTLPITTYRIQLPGSMKDITFSLNPGPWNIKEHVLVFIMVHLLLILVLNDPYNFV